MRAYTRLTTEEKLRFFSMFFTRQDAARRASEINNQLIIKHGGKDYAVRADKQCLRWCGTGWCSFNSSETACRKRYISCYTCLHQELDRSLVEEVKTDFSGFFELLTRELSKEYPIEKEVKFFFNVLNGIIEKMLKIGEDVSELQKSAGPALSAAKQIISTWSVRPYAEKEY